MYSLACETVVLLLEGNPDIGPLLDWVVDRCYTGTAAVADGCFNALSTIFSARYVILYYNMIQINKFNWSLNSNVMSNVNTAYY